METKTTTKKYRSALSFWSARLASLMGAFVLMAASSVSATPITISGTVTNDGDGGTISGPSISQVAGNQLYVYLIDNSNAIVDRSTVSSTNGTYSLSGTANSNYNVSLSTMYYNVGTTNPIMGLPTAFAPTAEGTTSIGDGTPDYSVAINSSSNITINFAVDARPTGYGYNYSSPTYDANGRVTFPAAAFTGTDPEDGNYSAGFYNRSVDLFQAAGGLLYYNGSLITFSSAASATRISSFDVSLLRFQPLSGSTHQFAFATVDNAGVPEYVPNSITLPGTPLPIEINSFTGTARSQDNVLVWQTSTEKSNKGFTIERSEDGVHFLNIASIPSQAKDGNSAMPLSYTFVDEGANKSASTVFYYRIRQTNYDGAFNYTNVVRLTNKSAANMQLALSPNPSAGSLNIDMATGSSTNENVSVVVVNATGRVVMSRSFDVNGRLSTAFDLSAYPAGTYYVQLKGTSIPAQVKPFVLMPH